MENLIRLTAFKTMLDVFLSQAIEQGKTLDGEWASDSNFDFPENFSQLCDSSVQLASQHTNKLLLQSYLDSAFHDDPSLLLDFQKLLLESFQDFPSL